MMRRDGFHLHLNPRCLSQIYFPDSLLSHSTHHHINLVSISQSHVGKAHPLKMDQMPRRYRNRRKTLRLATNTTLSSIIMRFCWLLVAIYLSCRAFFRRPLLCYCRRSVSDCVPSSSCNQLVIIGPQMKWRSRQLSFSSAKWYGDVIWIFDPGIIGAQIDNEGDLKKCFIQTLFHSTGSRQSIRIWWREIMLSLILRIYLDKFLPWISLSIKEVGESSVINFSLWGCLHGTRFRRWYSPFQKLSALAITKKDVISSSWRCFNGMRCNRWIATNNRFKVYWSFVKMMIAKHNDHVGLRKKTNKEDSGFDNLLACKAYQRK